MRYPFAGLLGSIDERDWMLYAQCRFISPYIFYPDPESPARVKQTLEREAKSICRQCTVKDECLDWALRHEENGVWGEKTETERRRILKKKRAS